MLVHTSARREKNGGARRRLPILLLVLVFQWQQQSYVTDERTFCIYLAEDEAAIREHAARSGFPANRIIEIRGVIDPSTAIT